VDEITPAVEELLRVAYEQNGSGRSRCSRAGRGRPLKRRPAMETPPMLVIIAVPAIAAFVVFVLFPWLWRHEEKNKRK
jgi:hypothetical protein